MSLVMISDMKSGRVLFSLPAWGRTDSMATSTFVWNKSFHVTFASPISDIICYKKHQFCNVTCAGCTADGHIVCGATGCIPSVCEFPFLKPPMMHWRHQNLPGCRAVCPEGRCSLQDPTACSTKIRASIMLRKGTKEIGGSEGPG